MVIHPLLYIGGLLWWHLKFERLDVFVYIGVCIEN